MKCGKCNTEMRVERRKDMTDPNKVTLPFIAWCPSCGDWYHCQDPEKKDD